MTRPNVNTTFHSHIMQPAPSVHTILPVLQCRHGRYRRRSFNECTRPLSARDSLSIPTIFRSPSRSVQEPGVGLPVRHFMPLSRLNSRRMAVGDVAIYHSLRRGYYFMTLSITQYGAQSAAWLGRCDVIHPCSCLVSQGSLSFSRLMPCWAPIIYRHGSVVAVPL